MSHYETEAKQKWGTTSAYQEYKKKTAAYSKDKLQEVNDGLNALLAKFADCMQCGCAADSTEAQALVIKLKTYITENYYTCTNQILAGLGQMYVADERFKTSIDKHGNGTAEYVCKAIEIYCS